MSGALGKKLAWTIVVLATFVPGRIEANRTGFGPVDTVATHIYLILRAVDVVMSTRLVAVAELAAIELVSARHKIGKASAAEIEPQAVEHPFHTSDSFLDLHLQSDRRSSL